MDRASKVVITAWAVLAFLAQLYYVSGAWPDAAWVGCLVFATAILVGSRAPRAVGLIGAFSYVFPAVVQVLVGNYQPALSVVWLGAVLGGILFALLPLG